MNLVIAQSMEMSCLVLVDGLQKAILDGCSLGTSMKMFGLF